MTLSVATTGSYALLDLDTVEESHRVAAWLQCTRANFPGFSIKGLSDRPAAGMVATTAFGTGRLWTILSPPLRMSYDPSLVAPQQAQVFSLMLQLTGATVTRQESQSVQMRAGEMCVVDSRLPFEMEVDGQRSEFMVLQMPRHAVLSRHPQLEHYTARPFDADESGTTLVRTVFASLLESAWTMEEHQRTSILAALIQLLGALQIEPEKRSSRSRWRIARALAYIDSELADPGLSARRIAEAQGISRRRLDEIMIEMTGASLTSQIWLRRLEQAASDLLDERFSGSTVTQIAFAAGFEDAAHFSRAFKRRYRCTPREWRRERTQG